MSVVVGKGTRDLEPICIYIYIHISRFLSLLSFKTIPTRPSINMRKQYRRPPIDILSRDARCFRDDSGWTHGWQLGLTLARRSERSGRERERERGRCYQHLRGRHFLFMYVYEGPHCIDNASCTERMLRELIDFPRMSTTPCDFFDLECYSSTKNNF